LLCGRVVGTRVGTGGGARGENPPGAYRGRGTGHSEMTRLLVGLLLKRGSL
jgi:hypothetical protein